MATSVIPAFMDFYEQLGFAAPQQSRIFFDVKPQKVTDQISGPIEVSVPYAILKDKGMTPEYHFEYKPEETTKLELTVYAKTLEEVDAMILVIRFNGAAPTDAAGIDNCLSFDIPPTLGMESTKLISITKSKDTESGKDASTVHKAVLNYELTTYYA